MNQWVAAYLLVGLWYALMITWARAKAGQDRSVTGFIMTTLLWPVLTSLAVMAVTYLESARQEMAKLRRRRGERGM